MIFTYCSAPASAALVALLFVAVSIGASFLTPERSVATRTFMEPGRFPFQHASHHQSHRDGAVPHRAIARAIGIMLVAVAWLAYTTVVHVSLFANYLKS
jgi:hypothetical protein